MAKDFTEEQIEELIDAIIRHDANKVQELLNQGLDPNLCLDDDKVTPLHYAAQNNAVAIALLLLRAGADLNAQTDPDHMTPLEVARLHKHQDMIDFLLTYTGTSIH